MFSGGNGTASIAEALVAAGVELTLIVNCYDDGLSTGAIRKAMPGMLGPSDVRKNVARFSTEPGARELLERRIPVKFSTIDWMSFDHLEWPIKQYLMWGVRAVYRSEIQECAVGNLMFLGCYLVDRDFNKAVQRFQEAFKSSVRVLDVTDGKDRHLLGWSGSTVYTESEISTVPKRLPIDRLGFEEEGYPEINPEVDAVLRTADLIVYGPGTQHSSLLPSYMTVGVKEAIIANRCRKVYIENAVRDLDLCASETWWDLLSKFNRAMDRTFHVVLRPTTGLQPALVSDVLLASQYSKDGRHDGQAVAAKLLGSM